MSPSALSHSTLKLMTEGLAAEGLPECGGEEFLLCKNLPAPRLVGFLSPEKKLLFAF